MSARNGIEDVFSEYSWGFRTEDFDLMARCFSANADVTFPNGDRIVGGPAVIDYLRGLRSRFTGGWIAITNVLIVEESETEARTKAFYASIGDGPSGDPVIRSTGWYEDTFTHEDGKWRILLRRVHPDARRS